MVLLLSFSVFLVCLMLHSALFIACGDLGKIAAAFLSIPSSVMGGTTVFLFSSVTACGIRILGLLDWSRRDRIILAGSLAPAFGVELVPTFFDYLLPTTENVALEGFYEVNRPQHRLYYGRYWYLVTFLLPIFHKVTSSVTLLRLRQAV